jgi:hypothetical protein
MGTSQLGRGHKPCTGTESHRVAEREFAGEDTEERERHSSARVQERQRWGAQVKGAPQRVDVGWRARSTPTPPGRDVFRSRVRDQGSLPDKRCLRSQMIAQAAIREGGGWKGKNQIGDHALPQRGFGLSTPSGAERKGASPSNTRHRRQHESRQRATHEPRTHTQARRHNVGNNGAHSITPGVRTALQEGERHFFFSNFW